LEALGPLADGGKRRITSTEKAWTSRPASLSDHDPTTGVGLEGSGARMFHRSKVSVFLHNVAVLRRTLARGRPLKRPLYICRARGSEYHAAIAMTSLCAKVFYGSNDESH